ncbi:SAV_915 family protein [Streptomyces hydrogenans]|uniref:SAV_915 family protein n=1 Tax=Streptomyces hydrogenans TaxID=1873719 RepID=UPI0035D94BFF
MPRTPLADDRGPAQPAPEPTDAEPAEPAPAGRLCVPVRPGAHGVTARLYRTPVGARTAVAFTTPERLRATLGGDQPWIPLSEPALRALTRPLGVRALTVDPVLTAPFTPAPTPVRPSRTLEAALAAVPEATSAAVLEAASEAVPEAVPESAAQPTDQPPYSARPRPGTPCARRFDATARGTAA